MKWHYYEITRRRIRGLASRIDFKDGLDGIEMGFAMDLNINANRSTYQIPSNEQNPHSFKIVHIFSLNRTLTEDEMEIIQRGNYNINPITVEQNSHIRYLHKERKKNLDREDD